MDKHLEVFKEMISNEIEVTKSIQLEKKIGNLNYMIDGNESVVWDEVEEKQVADYSDTVNDLINERIIQDEENDRAVKDTEDYLNTHR